MDPSPLPASSRLGLTSICCIQQNLNEPKHRFKFHLPTFINSTLPSFPFLFFPFPFVMPNSQTTSSSSSIPPHTRAPSPSPTLAHPHDDEETEYTTTSKPNKPSSTTDTPLSSPSEEEEKHLGGTGSIEDPYVVGWQPEEKEDPYNWDKAKK